MPSVVTEILTLHIKKVYDKIKEYICRVTKNSVTVITGLIT